MGVVSLAILLRQHEGESRVDSDSEEQRQDTTAGQQQRGEGMLLQPGQSQEVVDGIVLCMCTCTCIVVCRRECGRGVVSRRQQHPERPHSTLHKPRVAVPNT